MTGEGVALPFTAWEQAVFVSIFVIFVIALLAGLLNWFTRQQAAWQRFIQERDKDWQSWLDRSEARAASQMEGVIKTLEQLTAKLDKHDDDVRSELSRLVPRQTRK